MAKVIILPKPGFTQETGKIASWHVQQGGKVVKGEPLFDVHTDKTVTTVEATEDGVLLKIVLEPDVEVPVFTPIAVVGQQGEDAEAALAAHVMDVAPDAEVKGDFAQEKKAEVKTIQLTAEPEKLKITPRARRYVKENEIDPACLAGIKGTGFEGGITEKDIKASPLARKIAKAKGVDLAAVSGSGTGGKVMKADVEKTGIFQGNEGKRIASVTPYSGVRKIIGDRLSQSKFTAPHLYFTDAVDTTNLTAFRKQINENSDIKYTVSDLLVMAASKALQKYPGVNSSLIDGEVVTYESTNIGVAVAGDQGLIVPVIKNVQDKKLSQIALEGHDLVQRAKDNRLAPWEYSDGTFTISNLGMFGIGNFTAIINPPEAAILAISSVRKTPVVITDDDGSDTIAIRPMMNIQLSVDHRLIDGLLAAQFVEYYKQLLENPLLMLL